MKKPQRDQTGAVLHFADKTAALAEGDIGHLHFAFDNGVYAELQGTNRRYPGAILIA